MHIGIDARLAITNDRGHGKYIRGLINGLLSIDKQNEYFLYVDTQDTLMRLPCHANSHIIVVESCNYVYWEQIPFPRQLRENKIDLVFLSNHTAPWFCPFPSVVTIHDVLYMDPISLRQPVRQIVGRLYKRLCAPRSARYAQNVLTDSEYSRQQIIKRIGIPAAKVNVIYASIEPVFQQPKIGDDASAFLQKHGLVSGEYMLCLGASDPRKNTLTILKVHQYLRSEGLANITLAISGMPRNEFNRLVSGTPNLSNLEKLALTEFVTNEELTILYQNAAVFLYISSGEGFGLPVLEAMACGTPVIASNNTSVPEIAGNAAKLVDPFAVAEIAQAVCQFLTDTHLRLEYVERGLNRVKEFAWETVARRVIKVFESAI